MRSEYMAAAAAQGADLTVDSMMLTLNLQLGVASLKTGDSKAGLSLLGAAVAAGTLGQGPQGGSGAAGKALAAKTAGQLGREGEAAVRAAYDIGKKEVLTINGRKRIPDGLTANALSEVKNVDRLSSTRQLRDYLEYSQRRGLRFDLYTRPDTRLSGSLRDAIDRGLINHLHIP
jgi:hypothetical protein